MEEGPEEGAMSEVPDQEFVPLGWRREVKKRSSGMTAGKFDIYYYNEHGRKFRSRTELAAYLRENDIQLEEKDFDFSAAATDGKRDSVLAKSSTRRVSVLPDALDNRAASTGKRSTQRHQAGIGNRLRQRKQLDDHKVKPAKDTVVSSEMSRENEQDMSRGFSEDAAPEPAKTKTVMSNRTIDNETSFVNASERQLAVVQKPTQSASSSESLPHLDVPGNSKVRLSQLERRLTETRKDQHLEEMEEMEAGPEEVEDVLSELQDRDAVPLGWRREVKKRSSGMTAGKIDVYYYNEHGRKFRSRTELAAYLRENDIQLEEKDFDFSSTAAEGKRGSVLSKSSTRRVSVTSHGRRDSVLAKSFTRPVSVTSDVLDNWAARTGKRSIRLHQTWIDNRLQWREQMDDHKVKPAKDTVVGSEMSREHEQDISNGFSEGAAPGSAKTDTDAYCMSNGAVDNESFVESSFVNASERQLAVVQKPTQSASSSKIFPHSDVLGQKNRWSQLGRRPTTARKRQRETK